MALKFSQTIKSVAVGLALYFGGTGVLDYLVDFPLRSRIESQEELDRIVNSEATKLDLDKRKFSVQFFDRPYLEDPHVYSMILPHSEEANTAHVRSMLHQYGNLSEKEKTKGIKGIRALYFHLVRKPRADIYAILGH